MFPGINPSQVPSILRDLRTYAELHQDRSPSPEVRNRRKLCESHLPSNLTCYIHHISNHPPTGSSKPLAAVTPSGRCESCHGAVPTSWIARIRQQQGIFTCENCGALLLPTTND